VTLRVLLADDDHLVRLGLRALFESQSDIEVVGEAADGREAADLAARLGPDVVIMDVRMPNLDGLAATAEITGRGPRPPKVLVLTTFEIDDYVYEALRAGASGFLLKRSPPDEVLDAVRIVSASDTLLFPEMTRRLVEQFAAAVDSDPELIRAIESLTEREAAVLALMARGCSNQEIADDLYVGVETVKSHVKAILAKLSARDRTQAVIAAYESGFVRPGHDI
jgi:DNA-binding NarL/FixJ family response regulator